MIVTTQQHALHLRVAALASVLIAGCLLTACSNKSNSNKSTQTVEMDVETDVATDSAVRLLSESHIGFQQAHAERALIFPQDHGKHSGFKHEWWYLTANLRPVSSAPITQPSLNANIDKSVDNHLNDLQHKALQIPPEQYSPEQYNYGIQWTLFRNAVKADPKQTATSWQTPEIYLGHAAVSTPDRHFFDQRYARAGVGLANVVLSHPSAGSTDSLTEEPILTNKQTQHLLPKPYNFSAWIDNWILIGNYRETRSDSRSKADLKQLVVSANTPTFSYQLSLQNNGPLILQGQQGFSAKQAQAETGSHYYSQPFMQATGWLEVPVTETMNKQRIDVEGFAWLDREWSSQALAKQQEGWDWFSLHLADGNRLMLYQLRHQNGEHFLDGTWIHQDGTTQHLSSDMIHLQAQRFAHVAQRRLPMDWRIQIPSLALDITTRSLHDQQWLDADFPYWEGAIHVNGSHPGVGYMELTGYRQNQH